MYIVHASIIMTLKKLQFSIFVTLQLIFQKNLEKRETKVGIALLQVIKYAIKNIYIYMT